MVLKINEKNIYYFKIFEETPYCFPEWLYQFAFPPAVQKCSPLSTSSPTPVVSCVGYFSHSDRYDVISHYSFDLYLPDDE